MFLIRVNNNNNKWGERERDRERDKEIPQAGIENPRQQQRRLDFFIYIDSTVISHLIIEKIYSLGSREESRGEDRPGTRQLKISYYKFASLPSEQSSSSSSLSGFCNFLRDPPLSHQSFSDNSGKSASFLSLDAWLYDCYFWSFSLFLLVEII